MCCLSDPLRLTSCEAEADPSLNVYRWSWNCSLRKVWYRSSSLAIKARFTFVEFKGQIYLIVAWKLCFFLLDFQLVQLSRAVESKHHRGPSRVIEHLPVFSVSLAKSCLSMRTLFFRVAIRSPFVFVSSSPYSEFLVEKDHSLRHQLAPFPNIQIELCDLFRQMFCLFVVLSRLFATFQLRLTNFITLLSLYRVLPSTRVPSAIIITCSLYLWEANASNSAAFPSISSLFTECCTSDFPATVS